MEQLQAFDGGTCGTSDLTDVLGAVSPAPTFPAVLDACCGGRMFWWNKENPDALFMDCREVRNTKMLTKEQAQMLCDAHEVDSLLENEEEIELLEANNPELLEAYRALSRMAIGSGAK